MAYTSTLNRVCVEIEKARDRVADAQDAYSRGGSLAAVNRANSELADAHARYREYSGDRVPDRR